MRAQQLRDRAFARARLAGSRRRVLEYRTIVAVALARSGKLPEALRSREEARDPRARAAEPLLRPAPLAVTQVRSDLRDPGRVEQAARIDGEVIAVAPDEQQLRGVVPEHARGKDVEEGAHRGL